MITRNGPLVNSRFFVREDDFIDPIKVAGCLDNILATGASVNIQFQNGETFFRSDGTSVDYETLEMEQAVKNIIDKWRID